MFRGAEMPDDVPPGVKGKDLTPLLRLTAKGPLDESTLVEDLGLRAGGIRKTLQRLASADLIAESDQGWDATANGAALAKDAFMALMVTDFEPNLLEWLRAGDLKAPFGRTDGPNQL